MMEEIEAALPEIAHAPAGCAFSLTLPVPPALAAAFDPLQGDWIWRAPDGAQNLCGRGALIDDMEVAAWRELQRDWRRIGGDGAPPLAFLTAPPLGGALRLAAPKFLWRSGPAGAWLQLNGLRAQWDGLRAQAAEWLRLAEPAPVTPRPPAQAAAIRHLPVETPDFAVWRARVAAATAGIAARRFDKIVLARKLSFYASRAYDPDRLLRQMGPQARTGRRFRFPWRDGAVIADSPEILAEARGGQITSHALAGTAPRHDDEAADARARKMLVSSPKERREHEIVAAFIAQTLDGFCDAVTRSATPMIMRLPGLQHLWTPVSGRLRPGADLLDVIARLHPTPAVTGFPREAARDFLHQAEEDRDGLYTGLAGWIDGAGDGEAAVVLRAAFLRGAEAQLWAGAGVMAESRADAEWRETSLKMRAMRRLIEDNA